MDQIDGSVIFMLPFLLLVDLCQSIQPLSCSTHASEERKGTEQNLAQLPLTHNRGEILLESRDAGIFPHRWHGIHQLH